MSDRGIPRSVRMMQGFGVNTYTLQNETGQSFFVKFHWIPELGVHSLVWDEALKLAGQDPGDAESLVIFLRKLICIILYRLSPQGPRRSH